MNSVRARVAVTDYVPARPVPAVLPLEQQLLPVRQIAAVLAISEASVWRRLRAGDLGPVRKIGDSTRIHRDDVDRYARGGHA